MKTNSGRPKGPKRADTDRAVRSYSVWWATLAGLASELQRGAEAVAAQIDDTNHPLHNAVDAVGLSEVICDLIALSEHLPRAAPRPVLPDPLTD